VLSTEVEASYLGRAIVLGYACEMFRFE
jgi:hypothetical protein